jgi:hypothetical protein
MEEPPHKGGFSFGGLQTGLGVGEVGVAGVEVGRGALLAGVVPIELVAGPGV